LEQLGRPVEQRRGCAITAIPTVFPTTLGPLEQVEVVVPVSHLLA
jgi:hypothetical protein